MSHNLYVSSYHTSWVKQFSSSAVSHSTHTNNSCSNDHDASTEATSGKASVAGASTVNVPSQQIVTQLPPLTKPLADMPVLKYATVEPEHSNATQVTVLPNGLRVASERRFGQFCTVGGRLASKTNISVHP